MDRVSDSERVACTMTSEVEFDKSAALTAGTDSDEPKRSKASKTGYFSAFNNELHTYSIDLLTHLAK